MAAIDNLKDRIKTVGGPDELIAQVEKVEDLFAGAFTTAFDLSTMNSGVYDSVLLTLELQGFPDEAKAQLEKIKANVIAASIS